ncbi:MAG TPA: haloacid dehalogenase [Cyanobacteria bacterium UBA11149]|nr:haloacid dehalogenase [Cyanobacteria bacterium UBA11367]HBE60514.1 haloacid dehalogenase [Cyanobacteria bacterium UBA11366]HBK62530.1 haloacid dehalogenase [Cyanobacteria bacterium UBA11166]HBR75072.1 haloacid dehalogenase [Cyanobacteria bacterium UBA11159]HBS71273.1 haloacid dehalogenase [Cyanobacteria bacterium UBA11153]HBW89783.1 haloacid dehalogenase [Cyanobacteria bacterium UBA11149]HCA96073.1 haloacid dehalogenase [Cyanobacteria bacterium UBA9226]
MAIETSTLLALDFDGVICDGLLEYFQTSWRTYCKIWQPDSQTPPDNLANVFYHFRPVIEIGWEMPVLIRALIKGVPETKIEIDWSLVAKDIIELDKLDPVAIGKEVDKTRDEWIATDLDGWLGLHQFYPGIIERLKQIVTSDKSTELFIVTTKEGRFVKQLLQQQGIQLSEDRIIGKEIKRPKHQTLRQLSAQFPGKLWFVEDRLKTLQSVQEQPDLNQVRLFLADWGYNTKTQRDSVGDSSGIHLLSLSQFAQDFSLWH